MNLYKYANVGGPNAMEMIKAYLGSMKANKNCNLLLLFYLFIFSLAIVNLQFGSCLFISI